MGGGLGAELILDPALLVTQQNYSQSNLHQVDNNQFKQLMNLKTKVRSLKIESIRLHGDAFKMEHEYETMIDSVKMSS